MRNLYIERKGHMGKTIQVGGVGKNPAIEKINRLNGLNSRMKAAARLEEEAFFSRRAEEARDRRSKIIRDFAIDFGKTEGDRA